jgi:GAF domain-containing protein
MTTLKHASPERQVKLLHAAARVAKAVTSILDPDELLLRVADIICDEFSFYYAGVFLIDDSGQWAVLRAGRGELGAQQVAKGHKLAVGGHSMVGMATRLRQARIAQDVNEEIEFASNPYLPETRSEVAMPLVAGDEVIGALTVQSIEMSAFAEEDIATLQGMADQLAIAIENSRLNRQNRDLLQKAERRARLLQAANEAGKRLTSILDLDELLPRTVDIICEAYGFYYAGVFLIDPSGEWAVLRAGHGEAGAAMIAKGHKLAVGGHSMIGMATALREARIALDVGEERVHFKNPYLPHTRSEMALPLAVGDKLLGAVTVQSTEERAFSQDDIITLQTMADHLSVAIHNARTLKELERANAELLRTKTYEALATATTQAIHWIGNKALPMTTTVARMKGDLAADPLDRQSLREDLEMVEDSARLIVEVKENLLGPAREEKPGPVMLDDVVQAAAFHTAVPADRLTIEMAPGTPLGLADSTQLARAIGNLLRNSLEANAKHITVKIAPAAEADYVAVEIADDGEGIAPEMMEKIWAAFITTKGPSHPGLGLPACLHVLSQLHGRITATSQPGQGATFTLLLPIAAPEATELSLLASAASSILLIDDDDAWSQLVTKALAAAGRKVERRGSLGKAQNLSFDCILIDEALVAATLTEVLAVLKTAGVIDRAIVVAAALNVERATAYMQAGVHDVVSKPYTLDRLAGLL